MESGEIVDYIEDRKIVCGVVWESGNQILRVLNEYNREVRVGAQRLTHRGKGRLDLSESRNRLAETLGNLSARRNALAATIDITELWEILHPEAQWIDLETMTGLVFPRRDDDDHRAGVVRALFSGRRHFKFKPDRFLPHSAEEVAAIAAAEAEAARREALILAGAAWIRAVQAGLPHQRPDCHQQVADMLKSYYLLEKESPHAEVARSMMKGADLTSPEGLFHHLVAVGIWKPDENVELLRYRIPTDFPLTVLEQANALPDTPPDTLKKSGRVDLTHLTAITIDGQSTLDFDDALSIETRGDHYRVGIHISDVAHYIKKGGMLDREAMSRASSIYMPDQRISMAPPQLAEHRLSLKKDQVRPTISTMVKISLNGDLVSYDIFPSIIRVNHQLSYFEAYMNGEVGQRIATLHDIALRFRETRLNQGAIQIVLPEISVWLDESGTPVINRINRESPGRLLVAEMMILANWLCARFLAENKTPAIFRSQPKPKDRILKNGTGTLFQNWMQRKLLNRFVLRSGPDRHWGLGLDAYVTATSPIRKYYDLVTQRQIRSLLGLEQAYTTKEIDHIIEQLEQPMADIGRIQFRRNRYWLLKYLEGRIGEKEEAIVLQKRRTGYAILLKAYMIECALPQSSGIDLKPEDLVQVTIQHVNARSDTLTVFMG